MALKLNYAVSEIINDSFPLRFLQLGYRIVKEMAHCAGGKQKTKKTDLSNSVFPIKEEFSNQNKVRTFISQQVVPRKMKPTAARILH